MKRSPTFLLLPTDQNRSPTGIPPNFTLQSYTPFGWSRQLAKTNASIAFNGERHEARTGHYLLGNGYRAYNPVLMRFHSPDNISPFGDGGINCYAYSNDPINYTDPSGHSPMRIFNKNPKLKKPVDILQLLDFEINEMTQLETFFKSDPRILKYTKTPNALRLDEISMRKVLDNPDNISELAKKSLPQSLTNITASPKTSIHNRLVDIMNGQGGSASEASQILGEAYLSLPALSHLQKTTSAEYLFQNRTAYYRQRLYTRNFRKLFHNPKSVSAYAYAYAYNSHLQPRLEALSRLVRQ